MIVRESHPGGSRSSEEWFPVGDYRRGRDIFPLIPPIHRERPGWSFILVGALGVLTFIVAVIGSSLSGHVAAAEQSPCPPHLVHGSWCLVSQSDGGGR